MLLKKSSHFQLLLFPWDKVKIAPYPIYVSAAIQQIQKKGHLSLTSQSLSLWLFYMDRGRAVIKSTAKFAFSPTQCCHFT